MSGETLIIENVDLVLLEKQRKALNRLLFDCNRLGVGVCDPADVEELEGLESMLDHWSDEQERATR